MKEGTGFERLLGDKINDLAENIAEDFAMSKCEAMGIIGTIMLDANIQMLLKSTPAEKETIENFTLAACLGSNEYIFRK